MFAGQRDDGKAAFLQGCVQAAHIIAGGAEQDRGLRLVQTQQVDHGCLDLGGRDGHRLERDVAVAARVARGGNAQRVALIPLGQRDNRRGHGGGEQQRAAAVGRGVEDLFQILAEAHVEHLVRLVQNHRAQAREVERAAFQMIAQAAGRADHDMRAALQVAAFLRRIHAADAGRDPRPGLGIEPFQLAPDLQRQFARRRDDQRQWRSGGLGKAAQQLPCQRQAESHRLARSGLRRNDQVAPLRIVRKDGGLDRGGCFIAAFGKGLAKKGRKIGECHNALNNGAGRRGGRRNEWGHCVCRPDRLGPPECAMNGPVCGQ